MKNAKTTLLGAILPLLFLFTSSLSAQVFHQSYFPPSGSSISTPLGNSLVRYNCDIVHVNSVQEPGNSYDFQLTITDDNGLNANSFTFGDPGLDEKAHGVCLGLDEANEEFIICGESGNNNMLVMSVDLSGNVNWSTEVPFSFSALGSVNSVAISVEPVKIDTDLGYVVVGKAGGEVAAIKLDPNGNLIWNHYYPFDISYSHFNEFTDMTISAGLDAYQLCAITGTLIDNSTGEQRIFAFTIGTSSGYTIANPLIIGSKFFGEHFKFPQVTEFVDPDVISNSTEVVISFLNGFGSTLEELTVIHTDALDYSQIVNQANYQHHTSISLINNDLLWRNSNQFDFYLTNVNSLNNSVVLSLDNNLDFVNSNFVDPLINSHHGSIIKSCAGDYVFSSIGNGVHFDLVQNDNPDAPCVITEEWEREEVFYVDVLVASESTPAGTENPYPVIVDQVNLDILNCFGEQVGKKAASDLLTEQSPVWFYPNPTNRNLFIKNSTDAKIKLFNNLGQVILEQEIGASEVKISLPQLPRGIYHIEKRSPDGTIKNGQLVIQD